MRDFGRFPLERFPTSGKEVLLACANRGVMNHEGVTNALFADGSVVTYELELEIGRGLLPAGSTHIPVGPKSPIEALARMRAE